MNLPVLLVSAAVWACALWLFPWPAQVSLLGVIAATKPSVYLWLQLRYYLMCFVAPSLAIYGVTSWVKARWSTQRSSYGKPREHYLPERGDGLSVQIGTVEGEPLYIPERGLHLGTAVVAGKGWGKTTLLEEIMDQIVRYEAGNPERKTGGIIFELKGGRFLKSTRDIFKKYGREDDLLVVGPVEGNWTYNPVDFPLMDPYFIASSLGSIKINVGNPSMDSFWDDTAIDVVDAIIRIFRMSRGYHTLADIYDLLLDPSKIGDELERAEEKLTGPVSVLVDDRTWRKFKGIRNYGNFTFEPDRECLGPNGLTKGWWVALRTPKLIKYLEFRQATQNLDFGIDYEVFGSEDDLATFEHLKSWYKSWHNLEHKLRESIAKGPQTFFKPLAADMTLRRTFCPAEESNGRPRLHSFSEAIEQGKWVAISFGDQEVDGRVLKTVGVLCKLAFESAVNHRVTLIDGDPERYWRNVGMVADEFQIIASAGGRVPVGDETFFNVGARSGKCMVFATFQGSDSMKSAVGENWATVVQGLENKIFGRLGGQSAEWAAKESGKSYQRVRNYGITEVAHDTGISPLGGRPIASKSGIGTSKSYNEQLRDRVLGSEFMGLENFDAVYLGCDGTRAVGPVRFSTKGITNV